MEKSNKEMMKIMEENRTRLKDVAALKDKKDEYEEVVVKVKEAQKATSEQLENEMKRLSTELIAAADKLSELERIIEKSIFSTNPPGSRWRVLRATSLTEKSNCRRRSREVGCPRSRISRWVSIKPYGIVLRRFSQRGADASFQWRCQGRVTIRTSALQPQTGTDCGGNSIRISRLGDTRSCLVVLSREPRERERACHGRNNVIIRISGYYCPDYCTVMQLCNIDDVCLNYGNWSCDGLIFIENINELLWTLTFERSWNRPSHLHCHRLENMGSLSVDLLGTVVRLPPLQLQLHPRNSDSSNYASVEASSESAIQRQPELFTWSGGDRRDEDRRRRHRGKSYNATMTRVNLRKVRPGMLRNITPFTKSLLGLASIFTKEMY
ncbi:uncharacterized protein LOC143180159 [Calliopsis andreniformis]|uniref:uncharacterized protein LOC143180159 n=1 Tax=Calliopsis andreniformis TaxID=337506 RepID=UPI003FCD34D7